MRARDAGRSSCVTNLPFLIFHVRVHKSMTWLAVSRVCVTVPRDIKHRRIIIFSSPCRITILSKRVMSTPNEDRVITRTYVSIIIYYANHRDLSLNYEQAFNLRECNFHDAARRCDHLDILETLPFLFFIRIYGISSGVTSVFFKSALLSTIRPDIRSVIRER